MKIAFYLDCVSPHQVPLAKEVVKRVGADNVRYVYRDAVQEDRAALGWQMKGDADWFVHMGAHQDVARELIESADVLLTGFRDFDLFARRTAKGLVSFYTSERWFKPIDIRCFGVRLSLPGKMRLLRRSYRRMACHLVSCARCDRRFRYLAIGEHARTDIQRLGFHMEKIVPWAYCVEPSTAHCQRGISQDSLRVVWLGRMLDWKHPETVVQAARRLCAAGGGATFTFVGDGPMKRRLLQMAKGLPVSFLPPQTIGTIREIMREHDVYVLASDAGEGWGAALNEALEEGLHALGTYEAGSSATMLNETDLFHSGDSRALERLLARCVQEKKAGKLKGQGIGNWSAGKMAERLMALIGAVRN